MQNLCLDKVQYILFDWDGTIADTIEGHIISINEVLKKYGLPNWEEAKKLRNTNLSLKNNFPNIFGTLAREAFAEYSKKYEKNSPQYVNTFPYVYEVIKTLKDSGKKVMVITNKDRDLFNLECNRLFPQGTFDRAVCGNEAPRDKPYPDHAWYILDGYLTPKEINPENTWLVGDSMFDVECAINVNACPILVGNPVHNDKVVYFKDFEAFYKALLSSTK